MFIIILGFKGGFVNQAEVIRKLQIFKDNYSTEYDLIKIGLFGSYARNEASEDSDIDIAVEIRKPDLFILGSIKTDLEKIFGKSVDIVRLRDKMNKFLKKRIEKEIIYV